MPRYAAKEKTLAGVGASVAPEDKGTTSGTRRRVELLPQVRPLDEKRTLHGISATEVAKEAKPAKKELSRTREIPDESYEHVMEATNDIMRGGTEVMQSGEQLIARTVAMEVEHPPSQEITEAIEDFQTLVRGLWHKYNRVIAFAGAIAVGSSAVLGAHEYVTHHSRAEATSEQQPEQRRESVSETAWAVSKDVLNAIRLDRPKSSADLDQLITAKIRERFQRNGNRGTLTTSELTPYIRTTREHIGSRLNNMAEKGELALALQLQPLLGEQVTTIELCAYADNPAEATRQFQRIVADTEDRTLRTQRIEEALDSVSERDADQGGEDAYVHFVRRLAGNMQRIEAGSGAGRNAMHELGAELERGFHRQEEMIRNWDQHQGETNENHLRNIRAELVRVHDAERLMGIDPRIPLSQIDREIAVAARTRANNS